MDDVGVLHKQTLELASREVSLECDAIDFSSGGETEVWL
jgi:hypothetical protein